jgi:hypothetical protein
MPPWQNGNGNFIAPVISLRHLCGVAVFDVGNVLFDPNAAHRRHGAECQPSTADLLRFSEGCMPENTRAIMRIHLTPASMELFSEVADHQGMTPAGSDLET